MPCSWNYKYISVYELCFYSPTLFSKVIFFLVIKMKKKFYNTTTFHLLESISSNCSFVPIYCFRNFFNDFLNKNKHTCLFSTDPRFNLFQPLKNLETKYLTEIYNINWHFWHFIISEILGTPLTICNCY